MRIPVWRRPDSPTKRGPELFKQGDFQSGIFLVELCRLPEARAQALIRGKALLHLMTKRRVYEWAEILLLAAVYFASGKFGLSLARVSSATAVWPPMGIALAALLLRGNRLWPGIVLGALAVNYTITPSVPVAAVIAIGNTLEVVVGAGLGFADSPMGPTPWSGLSTSSNLSFWPR